MKDALRRFAKLSPHQRELVLKKLRQQELISAPDKGFQVSPIMPVSRDGNLPLSFSQQRLWVLDQLEPDSPLYNFPTTATSLTGRLDVAALARSFNEIIKRHEALRTTFVAVDGYPFQIIAPDLKVPLHTVDLEELSETAQAAQVRQLIVEEAQRTFDLACGPLVRATLLRLDEGEHILLLTAHHIVFDGWSVGIFIRELATLYEAFSTGRPPLLPELPIQYADFAAWQREWLQGEVLEEQLVYWKQQLDGCTTVLELPTDRPRPPVQTYRGTRQSFRLSQTLSEALKDFSRQEGNTLFMTLLAVFKVLLHRYTGQDDILVRSPIANRNRVEIEALIGFFVNTLVLRTGLGDNPTFRELLARVREVTLGAYAHQDLPFEKLVEELQPERDLSRNPLAQVGFILQNTPVEALRLAGLSLSLLEVDSGTAKTDLTLVMEETSQGLKGMFEYNTDLFDAATISRLVDHFQILLEAVVANPDERILDLSFLTQPERRRLLVAWARSEAEYPQDRCIHKLFETQVDKTPDAVAIVFDDQHLTYGQLNRRANQLAHHLRALGVRPALPVGVLVQRSPDMVVSLLGILKAGGSYLALDPEYPKDRLSFMLEDAQADFLLTQAHLFNRLSDYKGRVLYLDQSDSTAGWEETNPQVNTIPESLAYVAYTSGSTGQPKGILNRHRGVVNYLTFLAKTYDLNGANTVLQLASLSYDASVRDLIGPLTVGARVVIVDNPVQDPAALLAAIRKHQVDSLLSLVPSMLRVLTETAQAYELRCPSVRLILSSGESLYRLDCEQVREAFGDDTLVVNQYGPTECTMTSSYYPVSTLESGQHNVPIGRPIPNAQFYILDRRLYPVPIGVVGELYIGGVGMAQGYLNHPALSATKFIPHPFSIERGERLFKSGDLVRYLPDGNVEFLGRADFLVKIRGFRIELGEIETVLGQHPAVQETAVVARHAERESGDTSSSLREASRSVSGVDRPGKHLVAYVVADEGHESTISELSRFLQAKLPSYMVPSAFVALEALPLTPSGKVDRQALAVLEGPGPSVGEGFASPRNPIEEILASIMAKILKFERVGVHDNFFSIGGHSLAAMQLVSRVRDTFQVEMPLRAAFETATVADLAGRIETARRGALDGALPPLVPVSRDGELALSFAQQQWWFLNQWGTSNTPCADNTGIKRTPFHRLLAPIQYVLGRGTANRARKSANNVVAFSQDRRAPDSVPFAVRLTGSLDVATLEQSLNEIVRRHEILRTRFATVEGRPVPVIAPSLVLSLPLVDLSLLAETDREAEFQRLSAEQARRLFDLGQGPLLRASVFKLSAQEHVLRLNIHPMVFDDSSVGIFIREIGALYDAFSNGRPSPLPELPIQYVDYAAWQRGWLQGEALKGQLVYWEAQLGETLAAIELPTGRPRTPAQSFRAARLSLILPESLTDALKVLSQREGVTLSITLLAAFKTLLYHYTGQADVWVGVPVTNRSQNEIEGLMGLFTNTLVLRTDLAGDVTFRELLRRVREVTLGGYAHQYLPLETLVDSLRPGWGLKRLQLFRVMFVFQNTPMETLELPGLSLSVQKVDKGGTGSDLTLSIEDTQQSLKGSFTYNADLFDTATITQIVSDFQTLLERVVADPEQRLSTYHLHEENKRGTTPIIPG